MLYYYISPLPKSRCWSFDVVVFDRRSFSFYIVVSVRRRRSSCLMLIVGLLPPQVSLLLTSSSSSLFVVIVVRCRCLSFVVVRRRRCSSSLLLVVVVVSHCRLSYEGRDIALRQAVRDTSRVHSKPTRRPVTNRQMPRQGGGRGRRPHLPVRGCPG